jgi:hypothetical protein
MGGFGNGRVSDRSSHLVKLKGGEKDRPNNLGVGAQIGGAVVWGVCTSIRCARI